MSSKREMINKIGIESLGAAITLSMMVFMVVGGFHLLGQLNEPQVSHTIKHTASAQPQTVLERIALVEANDHCTATFTGTLNKGQEVTVTKVTYQSGFIMEKYHIAEQGGRWYYASSFDGIQCS